MDKVEIAIFESLDVDKLAITPESDLGYAVRHRVYTNVHLVSWYSVIHLDLKIVNGDFSIGIDGSIDSETKDILSRLVRRFDGKFSKQRLFVM